MCALPVWAQGSVVVEGRELLPIPVPNLDSEEAAVREQLVRERGELDAALASPNVTASDAAYDIGTMGELYYLYDLREAAGVCFDNAARLAPDEVRWNYLLAVTLTLQGKQSEALDNLNRVLEVDPGNTASWIRKGRLLFDLADYAAAKVAFSKALETKPESAAALGGLGMVAVREREWEPAVSQLRQALELQPSADALYYPLGQALRGTGDVAAAREALAKNNSGRLEFEDPWLQQMVQFSVSTEGMFHAGNRSLRAEKFGEAARFYEQYIAANPEHVRARYSLALCYLQINRRDEALRLLAEVLADDPEVRGGQRLMADALAEGGDWQASLPFFERAHQSEPDDAATVADWATVLAKLGRVDEAIEKLEPWAKPEAAEHYARLKYATILATEERGSEALPILREIVSSQGLRKGLRAEAHYHIGSLALAAGQRDVGLRNLEIALDLDPESALASAALAPLVAGAGDLRRGATLYETATKANPLDERSQFGLAMSFILSGRDAEAQAALENALEVLPTNDSLRHFLARVLAASEDPAVRDGARATEIARELLRRTPDPDYAQTLAMALAESGDFEQAVALQQQVVDSVRSRGGNGAQAQRFLDRYRAKQPVRAPWRP